MDERMDHGSIIAKEVMRLSGNETYPELYEKLSKLASVLASKTLPDWFIGKIKSADQIHSQASYSKLLTRSDAKIDWTKTAKEIDQKIRALNPEPGTWTTLEGRTVKILASRILNEQKIELPGKIYHHSGQMAVKCADVSLVIEKLQPEGKNVMTGKDFLNGLKTGPKLFL